MTCCGDPLITTPPPPPPPVGPDCLKTVWECECPAGVDQWGLLSHDCIPNANCTGQLSCTDLSCVIELFNGCIIGDPLPPPLAPFCAPHCCPDDVTTTTTTTPPPTTTTTTTTTTPPPTDSCWYLWEVEWQCNTSLPAGGSWGVVGDHPNPPTAGNVQVSCQLAPPPFEPVDQWNFSGSGGSACYATWLHQGTACTDSGDCTSPPTPPSIAGFPTPTPGDCCDNYEVFFGTTCNDAVQGQWSFLAANPTGDYVTGGWSYSCDTPFGIAGCLARCVVSAYDYFNNILPAGPVGSAGNCNGGDCCSAYFCNCTYTSTYDCDNATWSTAALVSCAPGLIDLASAWAVTSGCNAETVVSASGTCDPPTGPPIPCPLSEPPGCCAPVYCNVLWVSLWDCNTGAWSASTEVSTGNDAAPLDYPWSPGPDPYTSYDPGSCGLLFRNSDLGAC